MTKPKINLNINTEDHNTNDYMFCWDQFGKRPNKVTIYSHYNSEDFKVFIDDVKSEFSGIFTDVIPNDDSYVINEKILVKISDKVYLSFIQYDRMSESAIVGDINIIYSESESSEVDSIISKLQDIELDTELSEQKSTVITINQGSFELVPLKSIENNFEEIEKYYNDDVIKKANRLIKSLKKEEKGLSVIYGERGTGKTSLSSYISNNTSKVSIHIPSTMIESTINNPEFRTFISKYTNSLIILDDCEIYFSEMYSKSNIFTNNLLQLVDGIQSDEFNINIIAILNTDSYDQIDHVLLDCNNLIEVIEVRNLSEKRGNELSNHIGKKGKTKGESKLIDIIKKRESKSKKNKIGFQ